ncbi:hypothetical protein [Oceanobacillus halotolerans]|uniref:hypothetical protein n=1 Tax=Oceanobacillus halotolerans TaxID=2663380 RepID=UPI0013DCA363|nr:hypothetical protein [Oceanobacillus halotolerans]
MPKVDTKSKTIQRIGTETAITDETSLNHYILKSLPLRLRMQRDINVEYLQQYTVKKDLIYHPFWIAKTLVVAERPPFPAKKMPNVIFVDAVSGYRGVFSKIPPLQEEQVEKDSLVSLKVTDEDKARSYVKDVQERQINRSYVLKKPKHEIHSIELVYLPLWRVSIRSGLLNETFYINANNGESEKHMSKQW